MHNEEQAVAAARKCDTLLVAPRKRQHHQAARRAVLARGNRFHINEDVTWTSQCACSTSGVRDKWEVWLITEGNKLLTEQSTLFVARPLFQPSASAHPSPGCIPSRCWSTTGTLALKGHTSAALLGLFGENWYAQRREVGTKRPLLTLKCPKCTNGPEPQ